MSSCVPASLATFTKASASSGWGGARSELGALTGGRPSGARTSRLILTAGGRYDRLDLENTLTFRTGMPVVADAFDAFSPKLSATVKLLPDDASADVNLYGQYSQAFLPPRRPSGLRPGDDEVNLNPEDTSGGRDARELSWVSQNYLRDETLRAANARLVAAQTGIPLARAWGGGEVASADGLRFVVPVRTVHAGPNPKYFGIGRGVTYYNLVSDQFTGLHGITVPGTLRDSLVLLAVALEQQTELQPTQMRRWWRMRPRRGRRRRMEEAATARTRRLCCRTWKRRWRS